MAQAQLPLVTGTAPMRRLRRKTCVGNFGTVPYVEPAAGHGDRHDAPWPARFLASEGLEPEAGGTHKSVYLVTFPHATLAGARDQGLRDTNTCSHKDIAHAILDAFARPVYADAGNRARQTPTVQIERFVVFR